MKIHTRLEPQTFPNGSSPLKRLTMQPGFPLRETTDMRVETSEKHVSVDAAVTLKIESKANLL